MALHYNEVLFIFDLRIDRSIILEYFRIDSKQFRRNNSTAKRLEHIYSLQNNTSETLKKFSQETLDPIAILLLYLV